MSLNLDDLVAIDVHVHVEQDLHGHKSMDDELLDAASKYFKGDPYHPTVPQIADDYRALNMAAVVFTRSARKWPSRSRASSALVQWSRPWASARKDSVRSAVHLTGRPRRFEAHTHIVSSA